MRSVTSHSTDPPVFSLNLLIYILEIRYVPEGQTDGSFSRIGSTTVLIQLPDSVVASTTSGIPVN